MEFTVLLDSPSEAVGQVQIAKLGDDFEHAKFGKFAITTDDVDSWSRNLSLLPGGRAPIDEDHMADRTPRRTEASGWITGVSLDGGTPKATVEWTDKGKDAIGNKRYLFISPTFGNFTDEHGQVHENTLIGAALTNRPFLNMPTLTLASPDRVSEALEQDPASAFYRRALDGDLGDMALALVTLDVSQAERDKAKAENNSLPDGSYPIRNAKQLHAAAILAASKHGDWQAAQKLIRRRAGELGVSLSSLPGFAGEKPKSLDSRAPMANEALLKALDLPEDADEATILDAVTKLRATPAGEGEGTEAKTLEQQAEAEGKVVLDQAALEQIQLQAADGAAAKKELHEQKFDTAFKQAVKDRKVTPAERDSLHHFYTLDAAATLKMLDDREPILPEKPIGAPVLELDLETPSDPNQAVAAGVHPNAHENHRRILAKVKELDRPPGAYTQTMLEMQQRGELV